MVLALKEICKKHQMEGNDVHKDLVGQLNSIGTTAIQGAHARLINYYHHIQRNQSANLEIWMIRKAKDDLDEEEAAQDKKTVVGE